MVEFNNFLITLDGYIGGAPWFPMLLNLGGVHKAKMGGRK